MVKKIMVLLANTFMSLMLLLAVSSAIFLATFTGTNLKSWLREGKVYDEVIGAALDEAEKDLGASEVASLSDPGVREAAKRALSPTFLESSTNEVIDSTSAWVNGVIARPDFAIELQDVKNNFASYVGTYAADRFAALPNCQANQIPASTDVLKVECKPAGYNPEADIQKAVNELKNSDKFLSEEVITIDDFKIESNGQTVLFIDRFQNLPDAYQAYQLAPYLLGGIALISGVIVLLASETRRRGVKIITGTVIPVGLMLFLVAWLVDIGTDRLSREVNATLESGQSLKTILVSVTQLAGDDLWRVVMIWAVIVTTVGLGLAVGLILSHPNKVDQPSPLDKDSLPKESSEVISKSKSSQKSGHDT
jgi:hypothetical protein